MRPQMDSLKGSLPDIELDSLAAEERNENSNSLGRYRNFFCYFTLGSANGQ
jgi:hypothetical protein